MRNGGGVPRWYFRGLLIGYFEGIEGERGIAWRAADSLALRSFLGVGLNAMPPDHSTIARRRRRIDVETHPAGCGWVLELLAETGLLKGKTVGIDATTLEANAAMRSMVRRDTGEGYEEFLRRLAEESGLATPTREQLAKLDRKRAKKGSSEDWVNPHDPEAGITKLKDGRTHLAYKAEHRNFDAISRNRIVDGGVGKTNRKRSRRCMATGGRSAGSGGKNCCDGGAAGGVVGTQLRARQSALMLMQPRPRAETSRSIPNLRFCMVPSSLVQLSQRGTYRSGCCCFRGASTPESASTPAGNRAP